MAIPVAPNKAVGTKNQVECCRSFAINFELTVIFLFSFELIYQVSKIPFKNTVTESIEEGDLHQLLVHW
jgi:hypothetical protein